MLKAPVVLVQFRLTPSYPLPAFVRDSGNETAEAREARFAKNSHAGTLKKLCTWSGASLLVLPQRLRHSGLFLDGCHAQTRTTNGMNRERRTYLHLTFTFTDAKRGAHQGDAFFAELTSTRYDHVIVSKGRSHSGGRMLVIHAKTMAQPAKALQRVNDPVADEFGVVVSRAVPKSERELAPGEVPVTRSKIVASTLYPEPLRETRMAAAFAAAGHVFSR